MDYASHELDALVQAHLAADTSPRARLRRVVSSILEDPAAHHDIARLAERAAMSPRTLSRAFRRETGTSPARFVEHARLRLARALLERGDFRVASVASRAGFRNAERMRRAFHRGLGASPSRLAQSTGSGTTRR